MQKPWERFQEPATTTAGPWTKFKEPAKPAPKKIDQSKIGKDPVRDYTNAQRTAQDARELALGTAEGLGIDLQAPITGTLKNLWNLGRNVIPGAAISAIPGASLIPGAKAEVDRSRDTLKQMLIDPSAAQFSKAKQYWQDGNYAGAVTHAAAGAVPLIGPAAANIGTEIREGLESGNSQQVAGGVGKGIGLVGSMAATTPQGRAATAAVIKKTAGAVRTGTSAVTRTASKTAAAAKGIVTGVPPEAKAAIIKGLKPYVRKLDFDKNLDLSMPEIKAAEKIMGKKIADVDDLIEGTKVAKREVWKEYEAMSGTVGSKVNGRTIADGMQKAIPRKIQLKDPKEAARLKKQAAFYRQDFDISDLEDILVDTNAELEAYYNKYPAARKKALSANPETAMLEAEAREIRKAIYAKIDSAGSGAAPKELKKIYGAISEVQGEAYRRKNVAMRAAPESLTEQMGRLHAGIQVAKGVVKGAGELATGSFPVGGAADIASAIGGRKVAAAIKEFNSTNNLIKTAFEKWDIPPKRTPFTQPGPLFNQPAKAAAAPVAVPLTRAQATTVPAPVAPPVAVPTPATPTSVVPGGAVLPPPSSQPRWGAQAPQNIPLQQMQAPAPSTVVPPAPSIMDDVVNQGLGVQDRQARAGGFVQPPPAPFDSPEMAAAAAEKAVKQTPAANIPLNQMNAPQVGPPPPVTLKTLLDLKENPPDWAADKGYARPKLSTLQALGRKMPRGGPADADLTAIAKQQIREHMEDTASMRQQAGIDAYSGVSAEDGQRLNAIGVETQEGLEAARKKALFTGHGVKSNSPVAHFSESADEIAAAMEAGKGKLYDRIVKEFKNAALDEWDRWVAENPSLPAAKKAFSKWLEQTAKE